MEEAAGPSIAKRKRTKRPRMLFLSAATPLSTLSTSSAEFSGSATEEDEDMANCLMLLARGRARDPESPPPAEEGACAEKFTSRRLAEADGKTGFYVYECKTCNKCFPSFQALGGHRASHKKPKLAAAQERREVEDDDGLRISLNSFSKPIFSSVISSKPKVHECSICGAEFSSGQALGGHMRRHRPLGGIPESPPDAKKARNVLPLDLNLPAPSDDDRSEFAVPPFVAKQPPILFSASALVDCHY